MRNQKCSKFLKYLLVFLCIGFTGNYKYFRGGFITRCHGSLFDKDGEIDAVQLEFPKELRKGGKRVVDRLGKATGKAIAQFYKSWYQ